MITLVIHQNATKYFKDRKEIKVEVKDYHSLMSFLVNSFPKFAELIKETKNNLTTDFFILNKNKKRVNLADVEANKKLKAIISIICLDKNLYSIKYLKKKNTEKTEKFGLM